MKNYITAVIFIWIVIVTTNCNDKVSRSPVEPLPQEGKITIHSIPEDFTIFLNGKNTGRKTPDSLIYLDEGSYEITLKKNYFKDTVLTIQISEDQKLDLTIDFLSNPSMYGKIILNSSPAGATVSINDSLTNLVTPVTLNSVLPGVYHIRFQKYSFRDIEFEAIARSSETLTYSKALRDTSIWIDYTPINSSIASSSLSAIAIDQNNVKWIGSLDAGLIRYDDNSFTSYNTLNSPLPTDRINCVSIDPVNNVWAGTDFGIGIFNGSGWIIYNRNNSGLTSEQINSVKFDENATAWIGTSGNLVKFDGVTWTIYNESQERDWINDLTIVNPNEIWLATSTAGIFKLENGNFVEIPKPVYNYPTYAVSSSSKDNSDNIWFCFYQDTSGRSGVSYWNGSVFTNSLIGSPNNLINHIFIDGTDNKWISTSEGFVHYTASNSVEIFRMQNSLISSDNIKASVVDTNGHIWIATLGGGLNKYKPPQ